jgi:peptidoglycan/LPS O-acetylase OafA/YrhL
VVTIRSDERRLTQPVDGWAGRRFHTMDGLRGVAAIVVVIGHIPHWTVHTFPHFYLAVDLFFMLSGFVISLAYEDRLKSRLPVLQFLIARYIRLYPLYIVGTLLGIVSTATALAMGKGELTVAAFPISATAALLMLPSPTWYQTFSLMPFNDPSWSLLYELLMNLCYALFLPWLNLTRLIVVVAVSAVALVWVDLHLHTLHTGFDWPTIPFGLCRVVFPYSVGVLLYRLLPRRAVLTWWACLLPAIFLAIVAAHAPRAELVELPAVMIAFPLLISSASCLDVPKSLLFAFLGSVSYPLYVMHYSVIVLISRTLHALQLEGAQYAPWLGISVIAGLVVLSACLERYYDIPVRAAASRRTRSQSIP